MLALNDIIRTAAICGLLVTSAAAQLLQFHEGVNSSAELGAALTGVGDIDGDGRDDYAAASRGLQRVELYPGASGSLIGPVGGGSNSGFGIDG